MKICYIKGLPIIPDGITDTTTIMDENLDLTDENPDMTDENSF